jgi:glutamate racemase
VLKQCAASCIIKQTTEGDKMTDKCRPIGFFDSGIGGISVLKTAFNLMPNENYIYYGDSKNAPYGQKSEEEIKHLSLNAGKVLFDYGVKAIVMACNTATSAAVKLMRQRYNIPVISMEPAVKPALEVDGKVVVLATPATVSQNRYNGLLQRLSAGDKVINIGCSGLVELIENGHTDDATINGYLESKLKGLGNEQIGAVVLGCTHYSFVEKSISRYMKANFNKGCRVFDGRNGTAKQLKHILMNKDMLCTQSPSRIEFLTSGAKENIQIYQELFDSF